MEKRVLKSLLKPSAFDEPTTTVRLMQTHVSFLFITDHFVYKIKKPVDMGFLNFTTLDRRRFYCNEEVRLNRRLCPDIYLGVLEVRDSPHGANLRGDGTVIDYAVKMKRLPEERMLDRLLDENAVSDGDIRRIARHIAAFHLAAERGGEIDNYGSLQSIRNNWDENFLQVSGFIGLTIERRDLCIIHDWVDRFMAAHEEVFGERVRQGFIRDCDGDIHAENICLADTVCIFDCIEFNSRFRYCDTAADLAFLLMDFDYHGKRELSRILQQEYLERTGDEGLAGGAAGFRGARRGGELARFSASRFSSSFRFAASSRDVRSDTRCSSHEIATIQGSSVAEHGSSPLDRSPKHLIEDNRPPKIRLYCTVRRISGQRIGTPATRYRDTPGARRR